MLPVSTALPNEQIGFHLTVKFGSNREKHTIAYTFEITSVLHMRIHKQKKHILPSLNKALEDMQVAWYYPTHHQEINSITSQSCPQVAAHRPRIVQ